MKAPRTETSMPMNAWVFQALLTFSPVRGAVPASFILLPNIGFPIAWEKQLEQKQDDMSALSNGFLAIPA